jgi:hypothetical protein
MHVIVCMSTSSRPQRSIIGTRRLPFPPASFSQRVAPWFAIVLAGSCVAPELGAAPPGRYGSYVSRDSNRSGSYVFGPSQKVRQAAPVRRYQQRSTTTVYPHTYSTRAAAPQSQSQSYSYTYPAAAPQSQARTQLYGYANSPTPPAGYTVIYPQPQRSASSSQRSTPYQARATTESRSRLSIPVSPTATPAMPMQNSATAPSQAPLDITPEPERPPKAILVEPAAKPLPPVPDFPEYALPVPGRPGYVRPPGNNDATYMIDVRGMTPGEKARDPKTGVAFVVPPTT